MIASSGLASSSGRRVVRSAPPDRPRDRPSGRCTAGGAVPTTRHDIRAG